MSIDSILRQLLNLYVLMLLFYIYIFIFSHNNMILFSISSQHQHKESKRIEKKGLTNDDLSYSCFWFDYLFDSLGSFSLFIYPLSLSVIQIKWWSWIPSLHFKLYWVIVTWLIHLKHLSKWYPFLLNSSEVSRTWNDFIGHHSLESSTINIGLF